MRERIKKQKEKKTKKLKKIDSTDRPRRRHTSRLNYIFSELIDSFNYFNCCNYVGLLLYHLIFNIYSLRDDPIQC